MSDSRQSRPPKFDFVPTPRQYGRLDTSSELVTCSVTDTGGLAFWSHPSSWAVAVSEVNDSRPRPEERRRVPANLPRTFIGPPQLITWRNPTPLLLLGLNEARDGFEVVYDPNDIGGRIDPMMLLNFRRTIR